MWPLFPSLELRLKHMYTLGWSTLAHFFLSFLFSVVREPIEGVQMQGELVFSFFLFLYVAPSPYTRKSCESQKRS
jgi:hypothetical protein